MTLHLITSKPLDHQGIPYSRSHCGQYISSRDFGIGGTESLDHPGWDRKYAHCKVCKKKVDKLRKGEAEDALR